MRHRPAFADFAALAAVTACLQVAGLRTLALTTHRLRPDEARGLADGPCQAGLRELHLGCYGVDRAAAEALAAAGQDGRLEALRVASFHDRDRPWAAGLLEAPESRGLAELSITAAEPAADLLARLGRSRPFDRLTTLALYKLRLDDADLEAFLAWLPASLTRLTLCQAGLGDRAAASLARAPRLRRLRRLDLSHNAITDAGAMALADSPNLLASTRLDLEGNAIGDRVRHAVRVRLGHHVVA
jgi:hypothetical protein